MANAGPDIMSATLTQIYGENLNKKFELKGSEVLIGRAVKADVRLQCPNVSRKHCILTCSEIGWNVKDCNSQNGTFINGRKLMPSESHLLQCGDIIFLGPPSEMPQAFCCDISYKPLDYEPTELTENLISVEEILISPEKKTSIQETPNALQGNRKRGYVIKKKFPIETSCVGKQRTITCNRKDSAEQLGQTAYEVQGKIVSSGWDTSLSLSTNFRHKRKVPSIYHSKEISNSPKNQKKTKIVLQLSSTYKEGEFGRSEQIDQISSTADDQVVNSQSLLDIQGDHGTHNFCSSSSDEVNASSSSHDAYSSQDEKKSETELLKSQLAMMSETIKELEKSNSLILKDLKNTSEENTTLYQQLNEQKKLQEELISCEVRAKKEVKEEILNKFEEDLLCNICTELFIKPTVLECTHTFCEFCIKEWKKKKNECPICRHKIENMTQVLTLEHFIDRSLQTLTPGQRDKRDELIKERLETEMNQRRNAKKSPRRRRSRRRLASSNRRPANNDSIEIVGERNVVLPIGLPPLLPLFLNNTHFRFPDALFSNSESITTTYNIYPVSP